MKEKENEERVWEFTKKKQERKMYRKSKQITKEGKRKRRKKIWKLREKNPEGKNAIEKASPKINENLLRLAKNK